VRCILDLESPGHGALLRRLLHDAAAMQVLITCGLGAFYAFSMLPAQ
jgi:hypothetical protein